VVRQVYVKIGFVCLLDNFAFLTRSFTCLLGKLRITTRRRAGIRLCRCPLEPGGRIRRQRYGAVVLVLLSLAIVLVLLLLVVNYIVLSCRAYFAFACDFIFIENAKIVVGSSSLTQPLLLYPGLGPVMLDNIWGVILLSLVINYIVFLLCMIYAVYSVCFGGSPFGNADKAGSSKTIKIIYSPINC
jgi:hypothetical protein